MEFKVGDKVIWESQARGVKKPKMGTIYGVVPARCVIFRKDLDEISKFTLMFDPGGLPRPEVSYLVKVNSNSVQSKAKLYWPRKNALIFVGNKRTVSELIKEYVKAKKEK